MISVYTQADCRACKRVLAMFAEAGVEVETVDLDRNLIALNYVKRALNAKSVPVIEKDNGDVIFGYQPEQIKELINDVLSGR